jgi:hypothetical protein
MVDTSTTDYLIYYFRRILFDFEEIHLYKKRYVKSKRREVGAVL